ncbi:hypothetical protein C8R45DRAFT_1114803 [Mycena sanguinolenta]|nr:hypothetical protein C8R45DRAFT_1114803 [Mycena sanguinolenta]
MDHGTTLIHLSQFAYHEASFFLVRLFQTFLSVSLDLAAQPPAARPPPSWKINDKSGWTAHEKIRPRSHMTMFVFGGLWVRMEEADAIAAEVKAIGCSLENWRSELEWRLREYCD